MPNNSSEFNDRPGTFDPRIVLEPRITIDPSRDRPVDPNRYPNPIAEPRTRRGPERVTGTTPDFVYIEAPPFDIHSYTDKIKWGSVPPMPYYEEISGDFAKEPVVAGDFYLWPDKNPKGGSCYVSLRIPRLRKPHLIIREKVEGTTLKVVDGRLTLSIELYPHNFEKERYENYHMWEETLEKQGLRKYSWNFKPLPINHAIGSILFPKEYMTPENQISFGVLGTFQALTHLSELGATALQNAIEKQQVQSVTAMCEILVGYNISSILHQETRSYSIHVALTQLMEKAVPGTVEKVRPDIKNHVLVLVSGHPLIEEVVVHLKPNQGNPLSQTFSSEGGQYSAQWDIEEASLLQVAWEANLYFRSKEWPVMHETGTLLKTKDNNILMIKPGQYMRTYTLTLFMVDANGNLLPQDSAPIQPSRVFCELTLKASYIRGEGDGVISSAFLMENQHPVSVILPNPPGQQEEELKLTVSVFQQESKNYAAMILNKDIRSIIIKVYPNLKVVFDMVAVEK